MKKYLLAILLSLFSIPALAGGGSEDAEWWVCDQLGMISEAPVWTSSGVYHSTRPDNMEREMLYEKMVAKHTDGAFEPAYQAQCRGFEQQGMAEKYLKWRLEKVSKRKIHILWIKFSY